MTSKRTPGVAVGIVSNLNDPDQQGRLKVELPWLGDGVETHWCRVAARQGGYSRGVFIRPELGDEVLVLFEQGDINQPWIIGGVWNGQDAPPGPGNVGGKNDHKFFQTRSGAQLVFNDGDDGGGIEIHDAKGKLHTHIDVPGRHIHSRADTGQIAISAPAGKIRIECKDLNVHSTETTTVNVKNGHTLDVTGARTLEVVERDLEQLAQNTLSINTPRLDLTVTDTAEIGTGATVLSVGQVAATIEPSFIIDHSGAVTRSHATATYRIGDFGTELAGVGRSGALTLNATHLGITADETFIARIGGAITAQYGQTLIKGASVAFGKDGGEGVSMTKAAVVNIMGGLINLNPQMFTGPATKALDVMLGFDNHNEAPGVPPAVAPVPLLTHGFIVPITLDVKTSILVNGLPMAGTGSTAFGLHTPPFLPAPWAPIPMTNRERLAGALLALFMPAVITSATMIGGMVAGLAAGESPSGVFTGTDLQYWRGRFFPYTTSVGAFLAFLSGLAPHPAASGSITIGSPNVIGEDMPFGMMLPIPHANSCSDIPVVPNAGVISMSNVMIGVSLQQIIAQMAMALLAFGLTKFVQNTKIYKSIADPVDVVSGARVDTDLDLEMPGPLPLTVTREHVSTAISAGLGGLTGLGNRLCFEQRLESPPIDAPPDRVWIWHTATLRTVELPFVTEPGQWHFDRAEQVEICRAGDDIWDITDIDGITHRFERWASRRARLAARFDRNGNTLRYVYDDLDPERLVGIIDSVDRVYRLEYAAGDRLAAIWCEGHPARPTHRRLRRYAYDDRGRLIATAGPDDVETRYRYDDAGRVIARDEPSGYTWHWHYDPLDRVTHTYGDDLRYYYEFDYQPGAEMTITRDHAGARTLWHYDKNRLVDRIIDPMGGVREETWEDNSLTAASTAEDLVVERDYDDRGRLVAETLVGGGTRRREYDARGYLIAEIGPTGAVTRYRRDARGNATVTHHPNGGRTLRRFDAAGRVIAEVGSDGIEHTHAFDDFGNLVQETHDGATTTHTHDPLGDVTATTHPDGSTVRFEYDAARRRVRAAYPDGTDERWAYDAAGNCTLHRARDGGAWRYDYDGAGRKTRTHTPEGRTLTSEYGLNDRYAGHHTDSGRGFRYRYDACDRLIEHATDDGVVDRYTYDPAGRLTRRDFGDGGHIEWTPAPHGEPAATRTADGTRRAFTYDPAERITDAVEYGPAALTREGPKAADAVQVQFNRRADGVVLAEHGPHASIKYAYAPGGALTRYRVGDTDSRITRDARGRPTAIDAPDGTWTISHLPSGAVWTAPDGTTHRVGDTGWSVRDPAGRPLAAYAAELDPLGDCVGEELRRRAPDPTIDPDAAPPPARARGYHHTHRFDRDRRLDGAVDPDGNRRLPGATYGPGNRLIADAHGPVTHDRRGRITRRHTPDGEHRYRWDDLGRLTEVETPDGAIYTYRYDAFSRLVERTRDPVDGPVTRSTFIWAGDALAGEDRADGARVRYLRLGPREFTPWAAHVTHPDGREALHRLHADIRGAVVAATGGDRLSFWAEYDPYGDVVADGGDFDPRLRLQGMWADPDTGLYLNRFRWYAPGWGRYLSPDPLGVEGNRNVYAYTDGDPIHFADPLGLGHKPVKPGTKNGDNDVADGDVTTTPQQQGTDLPPNSTGGNRIPNSELKAPPSKRGNAPIGSDGKPIELHHRDQTMNGPLDEMTFTDHRGGDNYKKNHPNTGQSPSNIDRKTFNQQRRDYWKNEWDSGRFDGL